MNENACSPFGNDMRNRALAVDAGVCPDVNRGEMPVIMKELGTEAPGPSVAENKPDELKPENLK